MNTNSIASDLLQGIAYMLPAALRTLVILGGLIFALTKLRPHRKPAIRLAAGLAALLFSHIAGWISSMAIAWMVTPDQFVLYHTIVSSVVTLISSAGIVLIISAVFVSRELPELDDTLYADKNSTNPSVSQSEANPYSSESSGVLE